MARLPFLDIHGWPGPSMDSAIPCFHKGYIFGSIKLVAVFFCAHLRTQCNRQVVYNYITTVSSLNASTFKTVYQTFKFDFRFLPYSTLDLRT